MVHSRNKGGRGERAMVKLLSGWWGSKFFRTPRSGAFATQGFTHADMNVAADVVTSDKSFPFSVEVKWQENWCLDQLLTSEVCKPWQWWEQCVDEAPRNMIPLLVFKRNRQPWLYMIDALDATHHGIKGRPFSILVPYDLRKRVKSRCTAWVQIGRFEDLMKTEKTAWEMK